jgi:hypothetical protein
LERRDVTPTIIEIANASLSRGLALLLTSNVGVALRLVGLDKAVIEHGVVLEQILQTDGSEVPNAWHDLRPSNERYTPSIGITRDALDLWHKQQDALADSLFKNQRLAGFFRENTGRGVFGRDTRRVRSGSGS